MHLLLGAIVFRYIYYIYNEYQLTISLYSSDDNISLHISEIPLFSTYITIKNFTDKNRRKPGKNMSSSWNSKKVIFLGQRLKEKERGWGKRGFFFLRSKSKNQI